MIRITDQYFWNIIFTIFYLALAVMGIIILQTEARLAPNELTVFDFALLSLASFRLTRLFVYDMVTKWFREQFWDAKKTKNGYILEKPKSGPRRTLADLLSCPWCFGLWAASLVTFFYFLTPVAYLPVLVLAISGITTLLQLFSRRLGAGLD